AALGSMRNAALPPSVLSRTWRMPEYVAVVNNVAVLRAVTVVVLLQECAPLLLTSESNTPSVLITAPPDADASELPRVVDQPRTLTTVEESVDKNVAIDGADVPRSSQLEISKTPVRVDEYPPLTLIQFEMDELSHPL